MNRKKYVVSLFVVAVCLVSCMKGSVCYAGNGDIKDWYVDIDKVYADVPELKASKKLESDFVNEQNQKLNDAVEKYKKDNDYENKRNKYMALLEEQKKYILKKTLTAKESENLDTAGKNANKLAEEINKIDYDIKVMAYKEDQVVKEKEMAINYMTIPRINTAIKNIAEKYEVNIRMKTTEKGYTSSDLLYINSKIDATPKIIDEIKRIISEEVSKK